MIASVRQSLPAALSATQVEVGEMVQGVVAQVHPEQVLLTLRPSQLNALLSLSSLSNHRAMTIENLRSSLRPGEQLEDLVVVSKNATTGLLIVANKRKGAAAGPSTLSGISKPSRGIDAIKTGQIVSGQIISHTPQGWMVQLGTNLRGQIHPCDVADDLSETAKGKRALTLDQDIKAYVLHNDRRTRMIDLSTRPSRLALENAGPIVDPEIEGLQDLKQGQKVRGLVKNVSDHGLFVSLGRDVTARVMIKELFDEVSFFSVSATYDSLCSTVCQRLAREI